MSDPNKDWLKEELKNLPDLEAPKTLLPKVMDTVRRRARQPWWARLVGPQAGLLRSSVLGAALFVLVLLLVVNPVQLLSDLPVVSTLLKLIPVLFDIAGALLLQTKIYQLPVLTVLVSAIVLSYAFLVVAASTIQRLVGVRK